ncbi:MAG TPA: ATP-dependent metallopeptidase FtsH/Yme1/Tma family protein, partial [Candidatus Brocadiia bacterium]|nr:ATP-dependent metallopeptidase FtsH/Yme1/Tma family protein [Candidatus Brocadiia bacterium]
RTVVVDLPDIRGRESILKVHAKKYRLAPTVDLKRLARGTPSFSGADLEAIMNEAALSATRAGKDMIDNNDLELARDKVRWGREKRSRVMDEADRRITAVHEGGHALVAMLLPEVEPIHKVSIISQGMALGMTMSLPEKDVYHLQRRKLLGQICVALAGRVAEETLCDDISTGASQDLETATDMARNMVCRWGMSDAVGPVTYSEGEDTVFLGREITRTRTHSEAMAVRIDQEIRDILTKAQQRARELIGANKDKLVAITDGLMAHEVLYREDIEKIMSGEALSPGDRASTEGEGGKR